MKTELNFALTISSKNEQLSMSLRSSYGDFHHCCFNILVLNPQSDILEFLEVDQDFFSLLSHTLLLRKYYIYLSRDCLKLLLAALS